MPNRPVQRIGSLRPVVVVTATAISLASVATAQTVEARIALIDAVRITLEEDPDIQIGAEAVERARAQLQTATGAFDLRGSATLDHQHDNSPLSGFGAGTPVANLVSDTTAYRGSVVRPFRSGPTLEGAVAITRSDINIATIPSNYATATLSLIQPLARGRGAVADLAVESAARLDVSASALDLHHRAAQSVLRTVIAYWRYVAAERQLEITRGSEARALKLLEETEALVAASNRPAADLKQVRGLVAERRAARLQSEQSRVESQTALGLAMGLGADRLAALPPPADSFPDIPDRLAPLGLSGDAFVAGSLAQRLDLQASRQRERSASERARGASDGLKPRIDLVGSLGYAGIGEGGSAARYFGAFLDPVAGANVSASLVYQWPGQNNVARGTLLREEAVYRQTQIASANLTREVVAGVTVAASAVERGRERVLLAREAADLYRSALEDEKTKLQLGLATIIDQIVTEDRLTQSLIDGVVAELSHAESIARLRFETGTLIQRAGDQYTVDQARLTTVPVK